MFQLYKLRWTVVVINYIGNGSKLSMFNEKFPFQVIVLVMSGDKLGQNLKIHSRISPFSARVLSRHVSVANMKNLFRNI